MDEGSAGSLREVSLPWFLSLPGLSPSQHCGVWGTQPPHDPINGLIFPQCVAVFDDTAVSSSLWGARLGRGATRLQLY